MLALVAVGGGLLHMVGWGFYLVDPWKRALWIGMTLFWIALLAYVRIVKPLFMLRRPYRVDEVRAGARRHHDAGDAARGPCGLPVPARPVRLADAVGQPVQDHRSSVLVLVQRRGADGRVEMTIRNLGDFTSGIARVPVGQRVYLDGPYGAFTIGNPADMHVLIAGGIGITPMMSMIRTLADRGDQRPAGADLRQQGLGLGDLSRGTGGAEVAAGPHRGPRAVAAAGGLDRRAGPHHAPRCSGAICRRPMPSHEYFICGPDVMMDAIEAALGEMKVPLSKYHSERYSFV